jgi:hypothetical protein
MPQRSVLRSASGARKLRALPRTASPAEIKKLRSLQAVAPAKDASTEARLAALEASSAAQFAYMQEAGPAIQALQGLADNHEKRLDEVYEAGARQALEQAELVKATRRELFAVRDLFGEKLQTTESALNAGTAAVIEAKFEQVEGFIVQLQTYFVGLSEREAAVEGVVAKDEATVENAFAFVDAKINQVGEIVKRFETGTAVATFQGAISLLP